MTLFVCIVPKLCGGRPRQANPGEDRLKSVPPYRAPQNKKGRRQECLRYPFFL
jgi:hypothetical protein